MRRDRLTPRLSMAFAWGLAVSLAVPPSADAPADSDPKLWIERMSEASRELTFHGVFSYSDGTGLSSFHYAHEVKDGVRHERLVHRDGPLRGFRRAGNDLFFFARPDDDMLSEEVQSDFLMEQLESNLMPDIDPANPHYTFLHVGAGRVANRQAVKICLVPKSKDRHGLELWLDESTGLLLRMIYFGPELEILEELKYARLKVGKVPGFAFRRRHPKNTEAQHLKVTHHVKPSKKLEMRAHTSQFSWMPEWVPPGFKISSQKIGNLDREESVPICHLSYSDGVAAFSVIVVKVLEEIGKPIEALRGATVTLERAAYDPWGVEHLIAVTGEIPLSTARRIAEGVAYRQL